MTVECLKNALALIENYFGRPLSTDERTARSQIYAAALKDIPDDVAAAALTKALTVCRYQNQLLVDWCTEIRKCRAPVSLQQTTCGRRPSLPPGRLSGTSTMPPTADW